MAYVLKSDVVVNDPTEKYKYLTPFGFSGRDVSIYLRNLESYGYNLTQTEFSILNDFINDLKSSGFWSNLTEIYPFIGNSPQSAMVKLKFKTHKSLKAVNTDTVDSLLDSSAWKFEGSGVVGVKPNRPYHERNSPCFDTGLLASDIGKDWSFATAIQDRSVLQSEVGARVIFGASLDEQAAKQVLVELTNNTSTTTKVLSAANRSGRVYGDVTLTNTGTDNSRILVVSSKGSSVLGISGGSKILEGVAPTYEEGIEDKKPLYLLAKSPYSLGGVTQGYNEGMSFAMVLNTKLNIQEAIELKNIILRFTAALGK